MRDRSIDFGKGLVVLAMIYSHVLAFFGDSGMFPAGGTIQTVVNLLAFSSFLFFFGRTVALAYLTKPFKKALPSMLRTFVRLVVAFYISGIAYRLLYANHKLKHETINSVLLLESIPGFSEFLIAFALAMLLVIVLWPLMKRIHKNVWLALAGSVVCLACCYIPYGSITDPRLCLLIGGTDQAYFPIVQYLPYFLCGIAFSGGEKKSRRILGAAAVVASAAGFVVFALRGWNLPNRFPPQWGWIVLPALITALIQLLGLWLTQYESKPLCILTDSIGHFGAKSLYYLLGSNLLIFTLAGKRIEPKITLEKGFWFWRQPIQAPFGAFLWSVVFIAVLFYIARVAGRGGKKRSDNGSKNL